jgi:hypothetical protein
MSGPAPALRRASPILDADVRAHQRLTQMQPMEWDVPVELVMPGLVPGIHVFCGIQARKTWMAGTSPAMTNSRQVVKKDQSAVHLK